MVEVIDEIKLVEKTKDGNDYYEVQYHVIDLQYNADNEELEKNDDNEEWKVVEKE